MKVVITGALGHIGSGLIRKLPYLLGDCEIFMIDNFYTQRYCSLFDLPPEGNYRFLEVDILSADLVELFSGADVVVHLAAITNAEGSFDKLKDVENVNFIGTKKVADACMKTNSKLIFLSTTSVYGTQKNIVDENCSDEDLSPQSPYAESKLNSELFLQSLKQELDYVILRFGTIFGYSEGMRFHTAVNKFCLQASLNKPVTVWKTAYNQQRPYLDIVDAVGSIAFFIRNSFFDQEIYNILTLNASVRDIITSIKNALGRDISIEYVDSRIMNQLSYEVLNSKAKEKGIKFIGNLDNGISNTLSHLSSIKSFR
jgi:nucleoside-diphosphate-sugar epimerase